VNGSNDFFAPPPQAAPSDSRYPPGWSPRPPKRRGVTAEGVSSALTNIASSWLARGLVTMSVGILVAVIRALWPG